MSNHVIEFLVSMGEPEYAQEVLTMRNRLEAFADGLDKAAMDCAIKAAEEAIRQRDDLLAAAIKVNALSIQSDAHIELRAAIASVKGGASKPSLTAAVTEATINGDPLYQVTGAPGVAA